MNRLIHSQSPYLLQHANNPVNWFPWGQEALQIAKLENKPILVSIGYSACHWCHVMERESFEDTLTADLMNEFFVCIKIDREERPDLDNIYMEAVQAMGINGGWPLNVFLMPNQKPFYGGTYFPNLKWKQLLANIADAFAKHENKLAASAEEFGRNLNKKETEKYGIVAGTIEFDADDLVEIVAKVTVQFDLEWGGMNRIPKFPMPAIWHFILEYAQLSKNRSLKEKVYFTLKKIGFGGIYDHLRGGFSRYSVDGEWFAPHFEKMAYDNGQLLELYAKAYQASKDYSFLEKIRETTEWIKAEMLHEQGGFYAALDADSEAIEGKFYTWDYSQLQTLVPDELPWLSKLYNLKPQGNWEEGVNILFQTHSYAEIANEFGLEEDILLKRLYKIKAKLLEERNTRILPGKDDKILAGWNGLLDAGLIQACYATGDESLLYLALENLWFIKGKMMVEGQLYRCYKGGKSYTPAFLEDYAAVIKASIMAFEASGMEEFLDFSVYLADYSLEHFHDESDGFFFFNNPHAEQLIANKKELFDNVIPASNSILARSFFRLSLLTYEEKYAKAALNMLGGMKDLILKEPGFLCNWANFLLENIHPTAEIAVVGKGAKEKARQLQAIIFSNLVVAWSETPTENVPILKGKTTDSNGNALIYVCFNKACRRPVSTVEEALKQLPYLF